MVFAEAAREEETRGTAVPARPAFLRTVVEGFQPSSPSSGPVSYGPVSSDSVPGADPILDSAVVISDSDCPSTADGMAGGDGSLPRGVLDWTASVVRGTASMRCPADPVKEGSGSAESAKAASSGMPGSGIPTPGIADGDLATVRGRVRVGTGGSTAEVEAAGPR